MNPILNAVYNRKDTILEQLLHTYNNYSDKYDLDETLKWVLSDTNELEYHEKIHYVERLLFAGARPSGKNYDGVPFLIHLIYNDDVALFELLIGFSPDVNDRCYDGDTVLHAVVECAINNKENSLEMLRNLLLMGANPHAKNDDGCTSLCSYLLSLEYDAYDFEFVELLIIHSNVNIVNSEKQTSLHMSVKNPNVGLDIIQLILANIRNVNARDAVGSTALMWCLKTMRSDISSILEIIDLLLSRGADINLKDKHGNTALHYVCQFQSDARLLDHLLKNNASVNVRNNLNETPFFNSLGKYEYMKKLISVNADLNVKMLTLPNVKLTALDMAELNCDLPSMLLIIFCGGIFNSTTIKCTLLHIQFSQFSMGDADEGKLLQNYVTKAKQMIASVRPLSHVARTVILNSLRCPKRTTFNDTQQAFLDKLSELNSLGLLPISMTNFLLFNELFNDEQWSFL